MGLMYFSVPYDKGNNYKNKKHLGLRVQRMRGAKIRPPGFQGSPSPRLVCLDFPVKKAGLPMRKERHQRSRGSEFHPQALLPSQLCGHRQVMPCPL